MSKVIHDYPPNYDKIQKGLNLEKDAPMVFSYGDKIYDPVGGGLDDALIEHEYTHQVQQLEEIKDIEKWWDKYIADVDFRLSQEIEAYRYQYKYFCFIVKDRNKRNEYLMGLASSVSSSNYGNIISYQDAIIKIKKDIQ